MTPKDPRALDAHFRFGENWQSFLSTVTADSIAEAERGLMRLFPHGEIAGRRMLDIGCGSGLSMLAALHLGAASIEGIDLDPASVGTARSLLAKEAPAARWSVDVKSVFELTPEHGGYDVVYSWGVLHHTGALWQAVERAAALVAPGGYLAIALYRRTPLCRFWTAEKRFYAGAGAPAQAAIRGLYKAAYVAGLLVTRRNPARYIAQYKSARGMDWQHDVHDWLGGHPYESTEPAPVTACLERLGFSLERVFEHPAVAMGLFGSHCDEYVAKRRFSPPPCPPPSRGRG